MKPQSGQNLVSAAFATHQISQELYNLAERVSKTEIGVLDLCEIAGASAARKASPALQELDLLLQYTKALAQYVQDISQLMSDTDKLDIANALETIPVRDLALGLSRQSADRSLPSSEPELF